MKQGELNQLIERAQLRMLEPAEERRLQEFLEANPKVWPDREEDMALTRLLDHMPDAPLASNFTSRVMQTIEREESRVHHIRRPFGLHWWAHSWFARIGIASCVALVAVFGWRQNVKLERAEVAESVATISEVASIPSVEILKDFDVIQSIGAVPAAADVAADLTLLAALE